MNVALPPCSACCSAPLRVAGKGLTHWYECKKCGSPADPATDKYWCAWCGKWGDHQSGWCAEWKQALRNVTQKNYK